MKIAGIETRAEPFIIAEIGNNHLGDPALAMKTLEAAATTGVDAVKFQMFRADELVTASEPVLKHVPQNRFSTQRERFAHMSLAREHYAALAARAASLGVMFLCTPFDADCADFLDRLVPAFKLASGDASNVSLIRHVAAKGKPLLVSTGLCEQAEVDELVGLLPKERTVLFHCVSAYPTPDADVNLELISFFARRYGIPIGFSDHTPDHVAAMAAVALGAVAVEKHFILSKDIAGGDRALSLTPPEMTEFVKSLRRVAVMRGAAPRKVMLSEAYGRSKLRRSPYSRRAARAGEALPLGDIAFLRPELPDAHTVRDVVEANGVTLTRDVGVETALGPHNATLGSAGEDRR